MSPCAQKTDVGDRGSVRPDPSTEEILLVSRMIEGGLIETQLTIPTAHCGGCISVIENALSGLEGVASARLNLSTKRATVKWREAPVAPPFVKALADAGFASSLFAIEDVETDQEMQRLLRATAIAGFAAMNIMLLSVSVWAGADNETRHLFHLVSGFLAIPTVFYSGSVFFRSAWSALRAGRTNMDVPISVGIILTLALSSHDAILNGPHAYFDAVTVLIFFLLAGRTLEHIMRKRARTAVLGLARMMPRGTIVIGSGGARNYRAIDLVDVGELLAVEPGDRIPLDGVVRVGSADVDGAAVTGEAIPVMVYPGSAVLSGMLNLNGNLEVEVSRTSQHSFIADMIRMMESAERGRARYRRLADKVASYYSPVVHALAAMTFITWTIATGDWHRSLAVAVSVLIITCPCALGLAIPMVQVVAARRLFQKGIALKDGSALERLAEVDTVVFDKTGTLTTGDLRMTGYTANSDDLKAAITLAKRSYHPTARAIAALDNGDLPLEIDELVEKPGFGLEARVGGGVYRLGRPDWTTDSPLQQQDTFPPRTSLSRDGRSVGFFEFSDSVRAQAREAITLLNSRRLEIELLSGDHFQNVSKLASFLGITKFQANLSPRQKVERLEDLGRLGSKTMMIGDGLNDGPSLSAAHVSMAPASAADVGRAAADLVFFGGGLMAVPEALQISHTSRRLIRQNLVFAIAYNALVIPIAMAGYVTPLIAAVAMSLSSISVVGNALRFPKGPERAPSVKSEDTVVIRSLVTS